jgi:hypothetical protein
MSIVERLRRKQLQHLAAMLSVALLNMVAYLTHSIPLILASLVLVLATMVGSMLDLYISARCPKCGYKLWLVVAKIAPLWLFKPRIHQCPSCGLSTTAPSVA